MAKLIKFGKNHWKKIILTTVPVGYGLNYLKNEYKTFRVMRDVCNEVNQYPISDYNKVLIVLNPVANKKRCEKMFKKYCEPVLHMAGYSVEIIKTKHVGHAKSIMENLKVLPDIVVVAGGDGTSSEVVTGILRRNNETCPILFLPLGENNSTAWNLMDNKIEEKSDFVKYLPQRVLTLIRSRIQHSPVIKFELIDKDHEMRKPIFGLSDFSWGVLKDIEVNKDKYWYFGPLRYYASAIFATLNQNLNKNITANMISTPPCPGCNKCEIAVKNKSWFNISKMLNPQLQQSSNQVRVHSMCSSEEDYKIDAKQIDIRSHKNSDLYFELNTAIIKDIPVSPKTLLNIVQQIQIQPSTVIESRTVDLIPAQSENQSYYIDGESYDARPIKISVVPSKLRYFY